MTRTFSYPCQGEEERRTEREERGERGRERRRKRKKKGRDASLIPPRAPPRRGFHEERETSAGLRRDLVSARSSARHGPAESEKAQASHEHYDLTWYYYAPYMAVRHISRREPLNLGRLEAADRLGRRPRIRRCRRALSGRAIPRLNA